MSLSTISWQQPYLNTFKYFGISSDKNVIKQGEVSCVMDTQIKCSIYKICGATPASNFINIPKSTNQTLGLTGKYFYLLFKPIPNKYFSFHIDVTTHEGIVVRVSFSNLFKEFKATSTWLQFPYIIHAPKDSVFEKTESTTKDLSGAAPPTTKWTILCIDLINLMHVYANRTFQSIRGFKLCANMLVKNVITSDSLYEPGVTHAEARIKGGSAFPRELAYPCEKYDNWHSLYDYVSFPSESFKKPFDSVGQSRIFANISASADTNQSVVQFHNQQQEQIQKSQQPKRVSAKQVYTQMNSGCAVPAAIDSLTRPKSSIHSKLTKISKELPCVGVSNAPVQELKSKISSADEKKEDIHVYPSLSKEIKPVNLNDFKSKSDELLSYTAPGEERKKTCLEPDPIIKLQKVVGFAGMVNSNCVLWTRDSQYLIYPCHAIVISYHLTTAQQWCYIGHTDKVSCLTINKESRILVSGQTGADSFIRFWDFNSRTCLAIVKTHDHSLSLIEFSTNSDVLCGVGKDKQGKTMLVMWNTKDVLTKGLVKVLAVAHSDIHISKIKIVPYDSTRMVSCGRENIKFWRLKDSTLRSCSVNLSEYMILDTKDHLSSNNTTNSTTTCLDFTDLSFDASFLSSSSTTNFNRSSSIYACTRSGQIFELDYAKMLVRNVRVLESLINLNNKLPTQITSSQLRLNCLALSDSFCVTGSDDGFARLWPLDFKQVCLEAEHEASVTTVNFSPDYRKVATATINGNLGILDMVNKDYSTLIRSHTDVILDASIDPLRKYIATISKDSTIRVWDYETCKQLYDFSAPNEKPTKLTYHPLGINTESIFACGFDSGKIRIFNVAKAKMLNELLSPYVKTAFLNETYRITDISYSKDGKCLVCGDASSYLYLYDSDRDYALIRVLPNSMSVVGSLCGSPDGKYVAVIGSSDFLITIFEASTLNEVLRIDMSSIGNNNSFDTAVCLAYSPYELNHILCVTASNKLLKFDARNGRFISSVSNIHRDHTANIAVSSDGRFLVTTGDGGMVKVWDYQMRLDQNFQMFIGHSIDVNKVLFTPDNGGLITVGDGIFFWDFLAFTIEKSTEMPEGRELEELKKLPIKVVREATTSNIVIEDADVKRKNTFQDPFVNDYRRIAVNTNLDSLGVSFEKPRTPPIPTDFESEIIDVNEVEDTYMNEDCLSFEQIVQLNGNESNKMQRYNSLPNLVGDLNQILTIIEPEEVQFSEINDEEQPVTVVDKPIGKKQVVYQKPHAIKHLHRRDKESKISKHRYAAPPDKCGLKFHSSIGFNGKYSTTNMIWSPESGFFAYSIGSMVIVEDLNTGVQTPLKGHHDDVTVLALQYDGVCMASASASVAFIKESSNETNDETGNQCQIVIWDTANLSRKKTLIHKNAVNITCLSYSRDDRFLVSIADFNNPSLIVWNNYNYSISASVEKLGSTVHDIAWDTSKCNEFAMCGAAGTLNFWILDEHPRNSSLKTHESEIPRAIKDLHNDDNFEFTSVAYGLDNLLFAATTHGYITVWDTKTNKCILHWQADTNEICTLLSIKQRLITGSSHGSLKLWTISPIYEMKRNPSKGTRKMEGLTIDNEIMLSGAIKCCKFDSSLDIGIAATTKGVLWYVNWLDNSTVRLVTTHGNQITSIGYINETSIATTSEDGTVRIWSLDDREQIAQFEVKIMALCQTHLNCDNQTFQSIAKYSRANKAKTPLLIVGYADGTVRVFDIDKVNIALKMHPLGSEVTVVQAIQNSPNVIAGSKEGVIAILNLKQALTIRLIYDHKGAPITSFDAAFNKEEKTHYWIAASRDRRVSIWQSKNNDEKFDMIDWLTFSAPKIEVTQENNKKIIKNRKYTEWLIYPPSLVKFAPNSDPDTIVYVGYGNDKEIKFYNIKSKKVLRTLSLNEWPECMVISPKCNLIAFGTNTRLLQLKDYNEGSFQDYSQHSDTVSTICFSSDGKRLFTAAFNEIFIWNVTV